MSEQALESAKKKQPILSKTAYVAGIVIILLIICAGLIAALGLGYKKFIVLENQLNGKNQSLIALKSQQQTLNEKLQSLNLAQKKLREDLSYNQQLTEQQIDGLKLQQSKNAIHQVAIKTDLYPVLLMAQYLPKPQAIALLEQVKMQRQLLSNQALESALAMDIKQLQEKPSIDWSGIYQRIELLHTLVPKLKIKDKPTEAIATKASTNQSKLAELWQKIKDKFSTLVVVERHGDEKVYQALQLQLSQLATAMMSLNQAQYRNQLQALLKNVNTDFKPDKLQERFMQNLTWLKEQAVAPTQVALQSLKLLKESKLQEGR